MDNIIKSKIDSIGNSIIKVSVSRICAIICIICSACSIALLVILVIFSKNGIEITSFSLYAGFLILFYTITAIYHFFPFRYKAKKVFFKLSHVFFILLIGGTYMPLCLITLKGGWGWTFFGIIIGLCTVGITLRSVFGYRWSGISESFYYFTLSWVWLIAVSKVSEEIGDYGIILYLTGFLILTLAMVFYRLAMYEVNKKYTVFLPMFYALLIISNVCHAVFMFKYVVNIV